MRHRIVRGQSATIVTYPLLAPDVGFIPVAPSAATVRVGTPAVALPDSGAAATVDSFSATVHATGASEGATSIPLTANVTVVKGRRYLVTAAYGETFVVRAALSGTTDQLRTAQPIPMRLDGGSTIAGIAVSASITSAQANDVGSGVVVWSVTLAGQVYSYAEQLEVVRRIPRWELDADRLTALMPSIETLRERSDLALDETINAALEMELLPRLRSRGIVEENIISTEALVPAHVAAVAYHLAKNDPSRGIDARQALREELGGALDLALGDTLAWYDAPQTADPAPSQARGDFASMGYTR